MPAITIGTITQHARARMHQRGITEGDVYWIAANATYDGPGELGSTRYRRSSGGYTYVLIRANNNHAVLTVWYY